MLEKFANFNDACGFGHQHYPQQQLGIVDIEETGLSFVENAILKARNAAKNSLPAMMIQVKSIS